MTCSKCKCKEEQYCATGSVYTYGGKTKYGRAGPDGVATAGGYSDKMVVNEHFGIKVPDGTPLEKAAPLLCAGYVHLICPYLSAINWGRGCMQRMLLIGAGGVCSVYHPNVRIYLCMYLCIYITLYNICILTIYIHTHTHT